MPLWCLNQLSARAHTKKAQIQLNNFRNLSLDANGNFSLNKTFPIPMGVYRSVQEAQTHKAVSKVNINDITKERIAEATSIECERTHLLPLKQMEHILLNKSTSNMSSEELNNLKLYGAIDEYDWCEKNWGCKYDTDGATTIKNLKSLFVVQFLTPWDLPYLWLKKISSDFPQLQYQILWEINDGKGTHGELTVKAGTIISDLHNHFNANKV